MDIKLQIILMVLKVTLLLVIVKTYARRTATTDGSRSRSSSFKQAVPLSSEYEESNEYPTLMNLIGGYFHQDYDIISEDSDEIIRVYKEEARPGNIKDLTDDIQRFLLAYKDQQDPELARTFERVFSPDANFHEWNYRTTREALLKVVEILSDQENQKTT